MWNDHISRNLLGTTYKNAIKLIEIVNIFKKLMRNKMDSEFKKLLVNYTIYIGIVTDPRFN